MSQHGVARENGVLFEQEEANVVVRVAGGVDRAKGGAGDGKLLAVDDGELAGVRCVFAEGGGGTEGEEVGDAADVVVVVVREKSGGDGGGFVGEDGAEGVAPQGEALGCVDEQTGAACADEISICALEGELTRGRGRRESVSLNITAGRGPKPFQDCRRGSGSRWTRAVRRRARAGARPAAL